MSRAPCRAELNFDLQGPKMTHPEKVSIKQRVFDEAKKLFIIVGYVWVVLVLLELHRWAIFRELDQTNRMDYKIGLLLINALVLGKVILLASDLHVAEQMKDKQLVYSILFKSAVFAMLLVCFDVLEEVLVGVMHGKSVAESIPTFGGGGLEGKLIVGAILFISLMPLFALVETRRILGEGKLRSFVLAKRPTAG
jgi:hypothetical protein